MNTMRRLLAVLLTAGLILSLTACGSEQDTLSANNQKETFTEPADATEEAPREEVTDAEAETGSDEAAQEEAEEGEAAEEDAGPGDEALAFVAMLKEFKDASLPKNSTDTVLNTAADAANSQSLYLWEEGNVPAVTEYTVNDSDYFDDPDFRPFVVTFPVPEGTEVKGAVVICAGGAFIFRNDLVEGSPVADALSKMGYHCFVVNYRLAPYTQQEGALDLARAVRFVRKNADAYGIDEKDIAVMGFSAGGILAGEMLLNFDGDVNGTVLDADYVPDELDAISADAAADGMIYSFYGALSVSNNDVETLKKGELPPTFYAYGTADGFYEQFMQNAAAVEEAGVLVESHAFQDQPHGYGLGTAEGQDANWAPLFDEFLTKVFGNN